MEDLEARVRPLQAERSELERMLEAEQQESDNKNKEMDEATKKTEQELRVQRDTLSADVVQAEEYFQLEEQCDNVFCSHRQAIPYA